MLSEEPVERINSPFDPEYKLDVTLGQIEQLGANEDCTVIVRDDTFYDGEGIKLVYLFDSEDKPLIPYFPLYANEDGEIFIDHNYWNGQVTEEEKRRVADKILQRT